MTISSETSSPENNQPTKNETHQSPSDSQVTDEKASLTMESVDSTAEATPAPEAEVLTETQTAEVEKTVVSKAELKIDELTRQLAEMTKKADSHWENVLRKQAELDNFEKRSARELENAHKYALEKFASELLAIKDSMELGIEAAAKPETALNVVHEGMSLTLKMLSDALHKFNILEINPIEEKFNPQWHEAMAMQPVPNVEEGTILHVHQKGYLLHERLLRPARVVVAKAMPAPPPTDSSAPATGDDKSLENQG